MTRITWGYGWRRESESYFAKLSSAVPSLSLATPPQFPGRQAFWLLFHLELLELHCLLSASSPSPSSPARREMNTAELPGPWHRPAHTHRTHAHPRHAEAPTTTAPQPPTVSMSVSLASFFLPPPCACLPKDSPFRILFYLPFCLSPFISLGLSFSLMFCISLCLYWSPFFFAFFSSEAFFTPISLYAKGNIHSIGFWDCCFSGHLPEFKSLALDSQVGV